MKKIDATELIVLLGGTSAVAELLGIKPPSVSEWKRKGGIPEDKLILLAPAVVRASGGRFRVWDVCPRNWHRVWPELVGSPGAPRVPATTEAA